MSNINLGRFIPKAFKTWTNLSIAAAMVLATTGGLALSQTKTPTAVLAYATALSADGLLASTNQQRSNNHQARLYINSKLAQAAQAKAQDMATQNYWSHTSSQGKTPWDFVKSAGYSFSDAGENLAYGYPSNSAVVAGWMNSPGHRANILNNRFQEVGFGYANSPNYQGRGPQTIIVALYARPMNKFTPPKTPVKTPAPRKIKRKPVPKVVHRVTSKLATHPVKKPSATIQSTPAPAAATPAPKSTSPTPQPQAAPPADPAPQPAIAHYFWVILEWWNMMYQ